ncbi:MAG: 3'-5' exonuclease [archaeon]
MRSRILQQISRPRLDGEISEYLNRMQNVDLNKKIDDARIVCIDLETTGLHTRRSNIVSMGGIAIKKKALDVKDSIFLLVKCEGRIDRESVLVHKITPSLLTDALELDNALKNVLGFVGNDVICSFSSFDCFFLNRDLRRIFGIPLLNPTVDVQKLGRKLLLSKDPYDRQLLDAEWVGLEELAARMKVPVVSRHTSVGDAYTMALALVGLIKKYKIETVKQLYALS